MKGNLYETYKEHDMARKLQADITEFGGQTRQHFPWHEWFDGDTWELKRGEDFTKPVRGMQATISAAAIRLGLTVATKGVDKDTLLVQATGKRAGGAPSIHLVP